MMVLLWIWQLPQNVIGWLISRFGTYEGDGVYRVRARIGVCLGEYIIVRHDAPEKTIKHESGHRAQSRVLGPLYLLVVGLPSVAMNLLSYTPLLSWDRYYERWPESWADRLGNVRR